MKYLIIVLFLMVGCTKNVLCPAVQMASNAFSSVVIEQCECANADLVKKDILKWINKKVVCDAVEEAGEESVSGPIANIVCPIAGSLLTKYISNKFDPNWQCAKASSCVGGLVDKAVAACKLIPAAN